MVIASISDLILTIELLIYPDSAGRRLSLNYSSVAHILSRIEDDHEGTLAVFKRCLTTGTMEARKSTRYSIRGLLSNIDNENEFLHNSHTRKASWHPYTIANILWTWNGVNIRVEAGSRYADNDDFDLFTEMSLLEVQCPELDREEQGYPETDTFWRGASAVALTRMRPDEVERTYIKDFVEWAGTTDDIAAVLSVAIERGTLNVETLKGILNQRSDSIATIHEGVL